MSPSVMEVLLAVMFISGPEVGVPIILKSSINHLSLLELLSKTILITRLFIDGKLFTDIELNPSVVRDPPPEGIKSIGVISPSYAVDAFPETL